MITTIHVEVDFPALADLVAYLRDNQQAAIDAATTAVTDATAKLKNSTDALSAAITKEQM
jgi:hypothetical protein